MPAEIWLTRETAGALRVHANVGLPPAGSTRYVDADKVHAMVHAEIGRRMAKRGLDHDGNRRAQV